MTPIGDTRKPSQFGLVVGLIFLGGALLIVLDPTGFQQNARIQSAIGGTLGEPQDQSHYQEAAIILLAAPGLLVLVNSLFAPTISQTLAVGIGGYAGAVVLVNAMYGSMDDGLLLFFLVSAGCLMYGCNVKRTGGPPD